MSGGYQWLGGSNTYTGTTSIASGATLALYYQGSISDGVSGTYSNSIVDNGTFNYSSSIALTLSGLISGSGGITTGSWANTLYLTHANTYTGYNLFNAGNVVISQDDNLGAIPVSATPGSINFNGGQLQTTQTFTLNAPAVKDVPTLRAIRESANRPYKP